MNSAAKSTTKITNRTKGRMSLAPNRNYEAKPFDQAHGRPQATEDVESLKRGD